MKAIIAYMPVIHQGYLDFIMRHTPADDLIILGASLTQPHRSLEKDIRAVDPYQIRDALGSFDIPITGQIIVIEKPQLESMRLYDLVIAPQDDILVQIVEKLNLRKVRYDNVFLRWDSSRSTKSDVVNCSESGTLASLNPQLISAVRNEAETSADWWRQVGAGIVLADGSIFGLAHNHHLPNEQQPYVDGDPRANYSKGQGIELSTAIHAEAELIARAAHDGVCLKGGYIVTTTFPCPPCAKLIGVAGLKSCYFFGGYSLLDGERILRYFGVKISRLTE